MIWVYTVHTFHSSTINLRKCILQAGEASSCSYSWRYLATGNHLHLCQNVGTVWALERKDINPSVRAKEEGWRQKQRQGSSRLFGGVEFIQFLAALAVLLVHQDDLKNRINSTSTKYFDEFCSTLDPDLTVDLCRKLS